MTPIHFFIRWFLIAFVVTLIASGAFARTLIGFPTINDLERQLNLVRNSTLPKLVQNENGEMFSVIYVRGAALGGGRYSAELQLVPK